jgi:hypothetical protein
METLRCALTLMMTGGDKPRKLGSDGTLRSGKCLTRCNPSTAQALEESWENSGFGG